MMTTTTTRFVFFILFSIMFSVGKNRQSSFLGRAGCYTDRNVLHCERNLCSKETADKDDFIKYIKWECVHNFNITRLELSDNQLNYSDVAEFERACSNIQEIDLSHNDIESLKGDWVMDYFNQNLIFLDISYNEKLCDWKNNIKKGLFSNHASPRIVSLFGCDMYFPANRSLTEIINDIKNHLGYENILLLGEEKSEKGDEEQKNARLEQKFDEIVESQRMEIESTKQKLETSSEMIVSQRELIQKMNRELSEYKVNLEESKWRERKLRNENERLENDMDNNPNNNSNNHHNNNNNTTIIIVLIVIVTVLAMMIPIMFFTLFLWKRWKVEEEKNRRQWNESLEMDIEHLERQRENLTDSPYRREPDYDDGDEDDDEEKEIKQSFHNSL